MKAIAFPLRGHGTVAVGLVAQMLQFGAALVLLPFIVTRLSQGEVAIWYIFVAIQGLVTLADFGFQPTIARAVASAWAGAPALLREGLTASASGEPNLRLAGQIAAAARRLYLALALAVLALLLTGGSWYVASLAQGTLSRSDVLVAWGVFALGTAANLYFLWIAPLLTGTGRVAESYLVVIVARGGFAVLGVIALLSGGGLTAIAAANLLSVLVSRIVAGRLLRPVEAAIASEPPRGGEVRAVLALLWPNASRMGLVALAAFLINRSNLFVLSSFVGLSTAASYAVSLQLLGAVAAVAQLPTQAVLPQMVGMRIRGDMAALRHTLLIRQAFLIAVMAVGAVAVVVVVPWALALVGSTVALLPTATLCLLALVLLLEANHANCAVIITTGNTVPFVRTGLISGVAVVAASLIAVRTGGGAFGVVLAQGLVQLAYNNWKWPLMLWKEVRR